METANMNKSKNNATPQRWERINIYKEISSIESMWWFLEDDCVTIL
jgi:hypothetical protein